jgi:hypothetical protein
MRRWILIAVYLSVSGTSPTLAAHLMCRAIGGGASFQISEVTEIPAAAVNMAGSEKCDIVYHVDGNRYELGGCNREYVGLWSPQEGSPLGHRHGRLQLVCE